MKVLILTNHYLDKTGGGSFASRAYANAFAEIAKESKIIYPDRMVSVKNYLNSKLQTKGVNYKKSKALKLLDIYLGKIHRYYKIFFKELVQYSPDIVVFDNSRCSAGLIKKVKKRGIKTITIHHNFEMEYYSDSPPHWALKKVFLFYMRKAEYEAVKYSNINLTLTNEDIILLQKNYDKERKSSFQRIGCFEYKKNNNDSVPSHSKASEKLTFVISGSLKSHQTEISLISFLKEYYPILLKLHPNSQLIIAGKEPSNTLQEICNKYTSIKLIPNPKDMKKITSLGDIYIAPTNLGGGLKLRVMDGLKSGLPVISHDISARGYEDFKDEKFLFTYNDIDSFKQNLEKLLLLFKDKSFNKEKIIKMYHNIFSFETGVSKLQKILHPMFFNCKN